MLTASAIAAAALAGCSGGSPDGETGGDGAPTTTQRGGSPQTVQDRETTRTEGDRETTTVSDELDLREANVTDVSIESRGGNSYRFDVTLYHDDDGESEYANWWQVEDLQGNRLGRRELLHAHSTAPFTRSETIDIPDGVSCVIVRGHDQIHEYGGQAMLVDVETGATRAVRQGIDPQSFEESDCP